MERSRWLLRPAAVVTLADLGLSDLQIAEYLGIHVAEVRALRQDCGPDISERRTEDDPRGLGDEAIPVQLHQLAERLGASGNYVAALRLRLRDHGSDCESAIAEKAARQIKGAMEEFRRLRDHIARRLGVPGQRAPEGGLVSFERWITRENVRRYRDLLKDVKDPHRRSALEWLLSEEERKFSAQEQSDPRNRAKRWHAKAEELRTIADHTPSPAARETFLRLAENYEKLAVDAEGPTRRGTAGPTKDTA